MCWTAGPALNELKVREGRKGEEGRGKEEEWRGEEEKKRGKGKRKGAERRGD